MSIRRFAALAACLTLVSCSDSDDPVPGADTGTDTADTGGGDTTTDVGDDAAPDTTSDVGTDTPSDVTDAGPDVPPDAADDADDADDADIAILCDTGLEWNGEECVPIETATCDMYTPFDFTHSDDGDEEDCITDDVCLTRGSGGPIYNGATEDEAASGGCASTSPEGTEWAPGPCFGNAGPFEPGFAAATGCSPQSAVGETLCLRIVATDEYYDIDMTSYTGGGGGGGFAYTRTLVDGGPCAAGATCSLDEDAVVCTCPEDAPGDGAVECAFQGACLEEPCADDAICTSLGGDAFECACNDGFNGDGFTCFPAGTCDPGCAVNERCDETGAAPECVCLDGYADDGDGCVEINECGAPATVYTFAPGDDPVCIHESVCLERSTDGGPFYNTVNSDEPDFDTCSQEVPTGTSWQYGPCAEIDEESWGNFIDATDCGPPDVVGEAMCMRIDATGDIYEFELLTWGRSGAATFSFSLAGVSACGANTECTNTVGSFDCACEDGFEGDPLAGCTDIDECESDDACPVDVECENFDGGYECNCPDGFAGPLCADIDECADDPCLPGVVCNNSEGSFECTEECTEAGLEFVPRVGCVDTSVCADDPCGPGNVCTPSTVDGFVCTCVGQTMDFAKTAFGDEVDCIAPDVCITRGDAYSIFNTVLDDPGFTNCDGPKPSGTLWSDAPCDESIDDDFGPFLSSDFADCGPPFIVDTPGCVRLADGRDIDITFTGWQSGGGDGVPPGGAFSYTRELTTHDAACPIIDEI